MSVDNARKVCTSVTLRERTFSIIAQRSRDNPLGFEIKFVVKSVVINVLWFIQFCRRDWNFTHGLTHHYYNLHSAVNPLRSFWYHWLVSISLFSYIIAIKDLISLLLFYHYRCHRGRWLFVVVVLFSPTTLLWRPFSFVYFAFFHCRWPKQSLKSKVLCHSATVMLI